MSAGTEDNLTIIKAKNGFIVTAERSGTFSPFSVRSFMLFMQYEDAIKYISDNFNETLINPECKL